MKAAVLREVRTPLQIEDVQISKPGPHEVLIRTAAAGVCHSDLHFIEGSYPYPLPAVLGHESSGVVEQVGAEVRTVKPGDHVITCLSAYCGHCEYCLTGRMNLCVSPDTQREKTDPPRLAQEAALQVDRSDVSEEIDRLRAHLSHFRTIATERGPAGKRLDFLTQEIFRELNTLGAKCRNAEMIRAVLEAKALCEQLREQVQNVE